MYELPGTRGRSNWPEKVPTLVYVLLGLLLLPLALVVAVLLVPKKSKQAIRARDKRIRIAGWVGVIAVLLATVWLENLLLDERSWTLPQMVVFFWSIWYLMDVITEAHAHWKESRRSRPPLWYR
jgi:hypothetical protein